MADRVEISTGLKAGWSLRAIAGHVGRDVSVISREVRRNMTKTAGYRPVTADVVAQRRRCRAQRRVIDTDPVLRARVVADLARSRTPRQIALRLRLEAGDVTVGLMAGSVPAEGVTVSHEAIYRWIYALPKGELAKEGILLRTKRTARRRRRPLGERTGGRIIGMVSIDDRPDDAADRRVPGHWEGDLVIGKAGKTAAATLVERTTRFTIILALPDGKNAEGLADTLIDTFAGLPAMITRSLTWDQGTEMARHAAVTLATGLPIYFAHPHTPWERPTNENTNGLIREYLPKGTEITDHQPYLTAIAEELNERPRPVLDGYTPREAFQQLLVASTT
jgi:transposase, IS30 family